MLRKFLDYIPASQDLFFKDVPSFPSKNKLTAGWFGVIKDLQPTERHYFLHPYTAPQQWYLIDDICKGNKQSPVNIVTKNVTYDKNLKPLNFEGYDVKGSSKWNIENNGHTGKYCQICCYGIYLFHFLGPCIHCGQG